MPCLHVFQKLRGQDGGLETKQLNDSYKRLRENVCYVINLKFHGSSFLVASL